MKKLQKQVDEVFKDAFGRTPLRQRLEDIFREAVELRNATDMRNLKEEVGDLLASAIALCNECEWDMEDRVRDSLNKIAIRKKQYQSLGRKAAIALLGGAFDPPTIGHIKLAEFILNTSGTFDEVWLVPCFSHMNGKEMASPEDRLAMCNLASKHDGRIKVFDYEIKNQLRGETYHFVKKLLSEDFSKNEYDFSIVIGQDNANTFNKWVNFQDLEKMMRFVVVSRVGINPDPDINWYYNPPHIYLYGGDVIPECSSTEARKIMLNIWVCPDINAYPKILNENVFNYIVEKRLYLP